MESYTHTPLQELQELVHFSTRTNRGEMIPYQTVKTFRKRILEILQFHNPKKNIDTEYILASSPILNQPVSLEVLKSRVEKIRSIHELLDNFMTQVCEKFESEQDQRQIFNMLLLALEVHIDQKNRLEGQPVIGHVLEVAYNILTKHVRTPNKTLVIAGLLHDTIEDNPLYLAKKQHLHKMHHTQDIEHKALNNIQFLIRGSNADANSEEYIEAKEVTDIISTVSKPDFDALIESQLQLGRQSGKRKIKNELYKNYIALVCENPKAVAVKYADFEVNAIDIIDRFPESTPHQIEKKHHQMRKYYCVFPVFRSYFQHITPDHPLYESRFDILGKLIKTLSDYKKYFADRGISSKAL